MINLKLLKFKNILAYKDEQIFNFIDNRVTLLEGSVGAGKSSISTILEEVLFNKNSRDFSKGDLVNRYSGDKGYYIYLEFSDHESEYTITKKVASTAKVTLTKDGVDISGHTATQTYEIIKNILKIDFSTFSKTIYQSLKSSMDFLTVTDANRKKFLVDMFGLHIYDDIDEDLKSKKKELDTKILDIKSILDKDKATLDKLSSNLQEKTTIEVPEKIDHSKEIEKLKDSLSMIKHGVATREAQSKLVSSLQQKIKSLVSENTLYEKKLDSIKDAISKSLEESKNIVLEETAPTDVSKELLSVTHEYAIKTSEQSALKNEFNKIKQEASIKTCPTCKQSIDTSAKFVILEGIKEKYNSTKPIVEQLSIKKQELESLDSQYKTYIKNSEKLKVLAQNLERFLEEKTSIELKIEDINKQVQNLQKELDVEVQNLQSLKVSDFSELEKSISLLQKEEKSSIEAYNSAILYNAKVEAHNESINSSRSLIDSLNKDIQNNHTKLDEYLEQQTFYEILIKANKDLISYKLESSIKVFEKYINEYLTELSGGNLALGFSIDNTKLVVNLFNKGVECSIKTLSSGQQTSVNIATLLAIRNTMAKISRNNINLLFLDEVVSTLDENLKLALVEVLLKEAYLNTILVSHGFSHPLATTKYVVVDKEGFSSIK